MFGPRFRVVLALLASVLLIGSAEALPTTAEPQFHQRVWSDVFQLAADKGQVVRRPIILKKQPSTSSTASRVFRGIPGKRAGGQTWRSRSFNAAAQKKGASTSALKLTPRTAKLLSNNIGSRVFYQSIKHEVYGKIPPEWGLFKQNNRGVGVKWADPQNANGSHVRIDKGVPTAGDAQKVDHVVVHHNGAIVGRDGKRYPGRKAEDDPLLFHVPYTMWKNWKSWHSP